MEPGAVRLADQHRIERRDASGARNRITGDHNDRFHQAFNAQLQQWISAVERGEHTGSTSWDGYAAALCATRGCSRSRARTAASSPSPWSTSPALYA
ncbi:hypothetical protein ACWFNE_12195 [Cellulomonas sp. NPDC055163]